MRCIRTGACGAVLLGALLVGPTGRADEMQPPKLFAFCMNVADSKHRSLLEQAQMLRELGFDGAAYPLWLGDDLDRICGSSTRPGYRFTCSRPSPT